MIATPMSEYPRLFHFEAKCGHLEPRLATRMEIARNGRAISENIKRLDCATCFREALRLRKAGGRR